MKANFTGTESVKASFTDVFGPYILLENGDNILLESGGKLLAESVPVDIAKASFAGTITIKGNFSGA